MISEILLGIVLVFFAWFLWENWKSSDTPPGPTNIPFLGSLVQIGLADPRSYIALDKLSKKYGDIMSVKLGFVDAVVVSSYEGIKDVLNRGETTGRDCTGIWWDRCLKQNIGVGFSNGKAWQETRKYCKDSMKDFGFGNRGAMEQLMHEEIEHLLKFMEKDRKHSNGKIHFSIHYFHISFINVMASLIMGSRHSYEDPQLHKLLKDSVDFVKNGVFGAGLLTAYPFLRFVFPDALGYNVQMAAANGVAEYATNLLAKRRKENYAKNPKCFTDEFLKKIDEDASNTNPLFTDDNFVISFSDIMQGGSETTSNSVNFTLLQLTCNRGVQDKMYNEILEVCGSDRLPCLDDKAKMPYTQAVLLEGFRWARVLVHGIPRKITQDFTYRKFRFRKGTVIMQNMHTVFFDEEFWGDPHTFRPERFLDDNKNLISCKTERIITFSVGKRNCFGEVLARDSSFLFLTSLVQTFSFKLPPNQGNPNLEPMMGVTLGPHAYDAIVERRIHI